MAAGQTALQNLDEARWSKLLAAESLVDIAAPWLSIVSDTIPNGQAGLLVAIENGNSNRQLAVWPADSKPSKPLEKLLKIALQEGQGTVQEAGSNTQLSYPVKFNDEVFAVVSMEIKSNSMDAIQNAMRQLQWGTAWLRSCVAKESGQEQVTEKQSTHLALDVIGSIIEPEDSKTASHQFVQRLVSEFDLERACIGFYLNGETRVTTISHSASFGKEMNFVRQIESAMDEAIDQETVILYPAKDDDLLRITAAHEALHDNHKTGNILTLPLMENGEVVGALLCEQGGGTIFTHGEINIIGGIAAFAGPLLMDKRRSNQHILFKVFSSAQRQFDRMFGLGYVGRKILVALVILVASFFTYADGTYYITADGSIKGEIQRAIVAPFDGFILSGDVSAGDAVKQGDLIMSLDDRDLALERLNWTSQKQERQFEFNRALGARNRSEIKIIEARIAQADIQIEMIDERLARAKMKAPFDGLIVSGDLSQSIGGAVRRGDVLFEIAPLNSYRLKLLVDETQISHVTEGHEGLLLTTSLPNKPFVFVVSKITPVAKALEGKTVFEVEAKILEEVELLRPGMTGIGKIDAGTENLFWIWTRSFLHWFRLTFWSLQY